MKKQQGFSLLEMLVVIAIIAIIGGVTSDIFIQIIKAQNKGNILTEVKQNGDIILNKIERIVRNAEEISGIGYKSTYNGVWNWTLNSTFLPDGTLTCPSGTQPVCGLIVKNSATTGGYTKIEFHLEPDRECASAPFTTADQDDSTSPPSCNGNIRIVTNTTNNALSDLQTSSSIGQVITNTEKRSGVSLLQTPTKPLISIKNTSGKPALVNIQYSLQQGIAAASRADSKASVPFDLTISLRSY